MSEIKFKAEDLTAEEQEVISGGFEQHSSEHSAPPFKKTRLNWLAYDSEQNLIGAATADLLWDWIYLDELWVDKTQRGQGLGLQLMSQVEDYASSQHLTGIWLWTQSWQAAEFYKRLDYEEFARFPDFPAGHFRLGFRKLLCTGATPQTPRRDIKRTKGSTSPQSIKTQTRSVISAAAPNCRHTPCVSTGESSVV